MYIENLTTHIMKSLNDNLYSDGVTQEGKAAFFTTLANFCIAVRDNPDKGHILNAYNKAFAKVDLLDSQVVNSFTYSRAHIQGRAWCDHKS